MTAHCVKVPDRVKNIGALLLLPSAVPQLLVNFQAGYPSQHIRILGHILRHLLPLCAVCRAQVNSHVNPGNLKFGHFSAWLAGVSVFYWI